MSDRYDPRLSTEAITLAFKEFTAQTAVSEDFFLNAPELLVRQEVFGNLLLQLRTKVLADDLPPEEFTARSHVAFEVPASTWQMWKKRHAGLWYARRIVARWPVRYEVDPDGRGAEAACTASLERFRAYPRATVQLPPGRYGAPALLHAVRDLHWDCSDPADQEGRPA